MLVAITNFPFLIDSLKHCISLSKPAKCDKSSLLVFCNTNFISLVDSLKHPAKCDKSFLLMFPLQFVFVNTEPSYCLAFDKNNVSFSIIKTVPSTDL